MGMFDSFRFETLPRLCRNGHVMREEWQTKDLDCSLDNYRIVADGRILEECNTADIDNYRAAGLKPHSPRPLVPADSAYSGTVHIYNECEQCTRWENLWLDIRDGRVVRMTTFAPHEERDDEEREIFFTAVPSAKVYLLQEGEGSFNGIEILGIFQSWKGAAEYAERWTSTEHHGGDKLDWGKPFTQSRWEAIDGNFVIIEMELRP